MAVSHRHGASPVWFDLGYLLRWQGEGYTGFQIRLTRRRGGNMCTLSLRRATDWWFDCVVCVSWDLIKVQRTRKKPSNG